MCMTYFYKFILLSFVILIYFSSAKYFSLDTIFSFEKEIPTN